jgi:catechol 2,3-dioxygenase
VTPHPLDELEIHPNTTVGPVALTVHNLEKMTTFYRHVLGLEILHLEADTAVLGTKQGVPLVAMLERPDAPEPATNATGLYHLAIVLPTRQDLARWFEHLFALGIRFGQSNHITHEAFYLADPEGNGLEIYQDWDPSQWNWNAETRKANPGPDQSVKIKIRELLNSQTEDRVWQGIPNGSRMGHVHLKIADTARTTDFYGKVLGMNIVMENPTIVFAAAGAYHHHIGNNTWKSADGPTPVVGARGLHHYTLVVPDSSEANRLAQKLHEAGYATEGSSAGFFVRDPSGNGVLIAHEPASVRGILAVIREQQSLIQARNSLLDSSD